MAEAVAIRGNRFLAAGTNHNVLRTAGESTRRIDLHGLTIVPGLIDTLHQADAEYDAAKRQALFVEAQKLMYESAWFGYIWFEPGNFLVHNRIQGFPAAWGSLREAEWWIDPSV